MLITADKGFGELVFKQSKSHQGVVLIRLKDQTVENTGKAIKFLLLKHGKMLKNKFTTVSEKEDGFKIRFGKIISRA